MGGKKLGTGHLASFAYSSESRPDRSRRQLRPAGFATASRSRGWMGRGVPLCHGQWCWCSTRVRGCSGLQVCQRVQAASTVGYVGGVAVQCSCQPVRVPRVLVFKMPDVTVPAPFWLSFYDSRMKFDRLLKISNKSSLQINSKIIALVTPTNLIRLLTM